MTKPAPHNDKLVGMKAIRQHLNNISEATTLAWSREYGLPIKKLGGIWIGHKQSIDKWFETFSAG